LEEEKKAVKKGEEMKVVLCGSLNFAEEMKKIKKNLTARGHEVTLPPSFKDFSINSFDDADNLKKDPEFYFKVKPTYMRNYFKIIEENDAILVVNIEKHDIRNYIGGNTFAEIMVAFHLNKKIFLLNPIPKDEKVSVMVDELKAVDPIIINGNLDLIR